MNVISGKFKGRKLKTLTGSQTRPTTGKVKEAVFSSVQSLVPGAVWLDLFAGSGSIGIEALSRGAEFVWFVEKNPRAAEIIKTNLHTLGISQDNAKVLRADAMTACRSIFQGGSRIDFAYIDPPYSDRMIYVKVITALEGLMVAGGMVIVEHERDYLPPGGIFDHLKTKFYGLSAVSIYKYGKGE